MFFNYWMDKQSVYIHRLEFCDQWKEHITDTWIFNSLHFIKKENVQEYNQTGCREAHMMKNWESGQESARNWYLPTTTQSLEVGRSPWQRPWLAACLHSEDALNQNLPPVFLTYRNCKAQLHEVLSKYYSMEYFKIVALKCHIIIPAASEVPVSPHGAFDLWHSKKKKKKKKMNRAIAHNFIHGCLGHCLASLFLQLLLCVCLP